MEEITVIEQHPLIRDGRSQASRQNPALSPESAKIDDRSWMDILNFVYLLARQVNYFDENMERNGTWQDFFHLSGPIQLALISKFDLKATEEGYKKAITNFLSGIDRGDPKPLFDQQFELAFKINQWYQNLNGEPSGFRQILRNLILTNLQQGVQQLVALGKSFPAIEAGYRIESAASYTQPLEAESIWALNIQRIPELTFTRASRDSMRRELGKKLNETFQVFYRGTEKIRNTVNTYFPKSLNIYDDTNTSLAQPVSADAFQNHEPHLGLLYSFLKLFEQVRNDLNTHTKNHLEFYYYQILRLTERSAQPDKAHLVFEVADPLPDHLLKKGTLFTAGEDKNGADQRFEQQAELLVQRARIAQLRTLFLEQKTVAKKTDGNATFIKTIKGAYAAIQANSADGQGAGFAGIDPPSWPTLGAKFSRLPEPDTTGQTKPYPDARLGIALASQVLFLQEGTRTITFSIDCELPVYLQNKNSADYRSFEKAVNSRFFFTPKTEFGLVEDGFDYQTQVNLLSSNFEGKSKTASAFQRYLDDPQALQSPLTDEQKRLVIKNIERRHAFRLALSGEKEWIWPDNVVVQVNNDNGVAKFQITVTLGPDDPPVVYFDPAVYGFDMGTRFPTAQLLLDPQCSFWIDTVGKNGSMIREKVSVYQAFRDMKTTNVMIDVSVQNVRNLTVQNVDGPQDPSKPFPPFGSTPVKNADFYVGSKEAFHKRLYADPDSSDFGLTLNIVWDGLPAELKKTYDMYTISPPKSENFKCQLDLLYQGAWKALDNGNEKNLFTGVDDKIVITAKNGFDPIQATPVVDQSVFTQATRNGFIRLRLGNQDFLHADYLKALSTQSAALALFAQLAAMKANADDPDAFFPASGTPLDVANALYRSNTDADDIKQGGDIPDADYDKYAPELPAEPYTPVIKEISLDYRAQANAFELEAFHLYPYEESNSLRLNLKETNPTLLPKFEDPEGDAGLVEKEGALYVGLENLSPGDTLSLLFQVAEATANPDLEEIKPSWHYLRDNQWVRLEPDAQVLSDETNGLIVSGIIELVIPRNINRNNTILPSDWYWLKASVPARSAAASQTLAIHPQAALASFAPAEGNDLERLAKPLEAETIGAFVEENPAIKSLVQPYRSFGGKPAEKEGRFYIRVSERLRHKGRAITLFDYESLLLDAFPQIYRLKCITHTLCCQGQDTDLELAPGYISIAVIPDLREQLYANRLEPKFSVGALRAMELYLQDRRSPFVQLKVLNPRYQRVSVAGNIRFTKGKSPEYYRQVLEKDITDFLSPWASGTQDRISFGGEIFKSYVLNFIEHRDYVDYVTDFVMKDEQGNEVDQVAARSARSILVSGQHAFKAIEE